MIKEGKALINYSKEFFKNLSSKLPVFYNPLMKINRDFTIFVLYSYNKIFNKKIEIFDCMAGTGIRSIRIIKEIPQVVKNILINDIKKESYENIIENLKINNIEGDNILVSNKDCREILVSNKFDYIDIDPFGTPVGFVEYSLRSLRKGGLIGITATDVSALSGSKPNSCFRKYNTIGIKTDFYLEFGIRNLIKYVIVEGLKYEYAMIPVFGYYYKHHYRVFFFKSLKSKDIKYLQSNIKKIFYCPVCGYKSLEESFCKICNNKMIELGPIYIGNIYDEVYLKYIKEISLEYLNEKLIEKDEIKILDRIENCDSKYNIWYYYDIRKLGRFYKKSIPKIDKILKENNGCRTHYTDYGIKSYSYPKI